VILYRSMHQQIELYMTFSLAALLSVLIIQAAAIFLSHIPHRSKSSVKSPSAGHQNFWYFSNAVTMAIPSGLLIYLHVSRDFLEVSGISLVASLLMLFLGAFYPVFFVRVFKPSILKRLGSRV